MPNWCEGQLKIRGKLKDVKRFLIEACGGTKRQSDTFGEIITIKSWAWVKDTHRGFISEFTEIYTENYEAWTLPVITLAYSQAWNIHTNELVELSKKYEVDLKIYAFEQGMCFNRDIEICGGKVVTDDEINFESGEDYEWRCICPGMGG